MSKKALPKTRPPLWSKRDTVVVLGLCVASFLLSANALNSEFVLDDASKIVGNTDLRRPDWASRLIYPYEQNQLLERNDPSRPLTFLVYTLLYRAFGLNPIPFHATNVFLHFVCAALIYVVTRRTLSTLVETHHRAFPALVAALFLATPIQMGTVIYAYALSDVLSSTLVLSALTVFVWRERPAWGTTAASLSLFILALFAKQSALVLPALLLAFDFFISSEGDWQKIRTRFRWHLPFWACALAYLYYRLQTFGALGDIEGRGNTHPAMEYALSQPFVILKYVVSTLIPWNLAIDHYVGPLQVTFGLRAAGFLFLALVGVGLFLLFRKKSPLSRFLLFAASFYFMVLAPTSSILPTVDLIVERRVYLANFGLLAALAVAWDSVGGWVFFKGIQKRWALPLAALQVCLLAGVSLYRNDIYSTNETLWQNVLSIYPNSERALNNLANSYTEKRDYNRARMLFEKLLELNPKDAYAHGNLGTLYEREDSPFHDVEKAMAHFEAALASSPEHFESLYNLSRLQQKLGNQTRDGRFLDRAFAGYLRVLELNPSHVLAHNNLGLLYLQQNRVAEARREFETALMLDPRCSPAKANLKMISGEAKPISP